MAGWDGNIVVNIYGDAQAVTTKNFGYPLHLTADVTYDTEVVKTYTKPSEASSDSELGTTAKDAAAAFFAQPNHPKKLHIGKATAGYGSIGTDLDAILAAEPEFYGVDLVDRTTAAILATATWVEANDRLYVAQSSASDILSGGVVDNPAKDLVTAARERTGIIYHATDTAHAALCWITNKLTCDPDSRTTMWAYATFSGITPDALNSTEHGNCVADKCNTYELFGGVGAACPGITSTSDKFDTLISKDWFKARVTEALQQMLLNVSSRNEKIPFTNLGLSMIGAQVQKIIDRGISLKHFRNTGWNLDIPDIADVPSADITARKATITATVILAGAIEEVQLDVTVLNAPA